MDTSGPIELRLEGEAPPDGLLRDFVDLEDLVAAFFFAFGIGMKYEDGRRPSTTSSVIPSSSNRKCRAGAANGVLRIGFSMTICGRGMARPG